MSNSLKLLHQLSLRQIDSFPVPSEPIGVSPGPSAWHAMLADQHLQISRSDSSGYQTPLPQLWVSASPEDSSIWLTLLYPSLASLPPREPHLTIAGQREQSVFKPHDRQSSPLSSSRCASRGNSAGQPIIWKYGDVEFHFSGDDDTLLLIHTDTFPTFPRGGRKLWLDPWIFRHSLTSEAIRGICQQLHLPCREFVAPWMGPAERRFLVGVGVEVSFATREGQKREQFTAVSYAQFRWASEGKYFVTKQTGNKSGSQL